MNKHTFFYTTILILIGVMATAQEKFQYGLKGGLNISNYSGELESTEATIEGQIAFHVGVMAEISLLNKFSIQPEVLYEVENFKISNLDEGKDTEFKLDFIAIPIMFKFYITDNIQVLAGPEYAINLDHERDNISNGRYDSTALDNINDRVGANIGVAYKLNNLSVYGRYRIGSSEVYNINYADLKSSGVYLGLEYFL